MTFSNFNYKISTKIKKGFFSSKILLSRSDIVICLLLLLNKIQLDIAAYYCLKYYDYYPIFENNLNLFSYLSTWLIFILSIPIQLKVFRGKELSNLVLGLLLLFSFNPQIVIMGYRPDYPIIYVLSMLGYWITLFISYFGIKKIKFQRIGPEFGNRTIIFISLFISAVVFYYSYKYANFRISLNLYDVYIIRAEAREYGSLGILNYVLAFADNVLAFLSIYFFHKKNYFFSAFLLFVVFVNFSITGTKQILFLFIVGFIGYLLINKAKDIYKLILGSNLILFVSIIEKAVFPSIRSLFFVFYPFRILFLPTELHYQFFKFFSSNPTEYFRQSFLRFFLDSPYEKPIHFLIGEFAVGDIQARANNGLFSDAFLNLSYFGIIIFPIFLVLILKVFDGMSLRLEPRLWFVIAIYMATVMLSVPLVNVLVNSGLILLLLLLRTLKVNKLPKKNNFF